VLGGYGAFGGRASTQLARQGIDVIVAGRSLLRAREFAASLAGRERASIEPLQMDAATAGPSELVALRAGVVINASGPFQLQDYRLARACIGAGAHYIDLADARAFVGGITSLDAEARRAGVLVVAGASTVPALSSAVLDAYAPQMATLEAACIVIAPSNSFDPGIATTRSILRMLGRPFAVPHGGSAAVGYGWQGLQRRCVAELGARWLGLCEVPDLDLLPARHAGLASVRVYAALEVGAFHLCLWGLSWLVRAGVLRNAERLANPLLAMKRAFGFLGSDVSGMAVTLIGRGRDGMARRIDWRLIARGGCGPYVPATPSVLLAKQLLGGKLAARGATPCVGLLTLADVIDELIGFDITAGVL
jgi:Saccharopine dehydrogenase NADP binding domain